MDIPSTNLPEPDIKEPLSFRVVKRNEEKNKKKKFLDKIIEPTFLKGYFKKKK
jgi:hypothetical protein